MYGHDAHRPATGFHIAFNVLTALAQPMDKTLQAGGVARLISERQMH